MALSVIGAGVGRTGTLSLKLALERLGLGPCYHMTEIFVGHLDHVALWQSAADRQAVDWDALFEDYQAAVDFPASAFYRELAAHYPSARVILTERDPERWYQSFRSTIFQPLTGELPDHLSAWGAMVHKAILERVFGGKVADKADAIAGYQRHNDEVKRTIPSQRLLVYEVSQGWEPLCRFLEVAVPDEPFPKVNSTDEWLEKIGSRLAPAAVQEGAAAK